MKCLCGVFFLFQLEQTNYKKTLWENSISDWEDSKKLLFDFSFVII